jgi:hypothetical protein
MDRFDRFVALARSAVPALALACAACGRTELRVVRANVHSDVSDVSAEARTDDAIADDSPARDDVPAMCSTGHYAVELRTDGSVRELTLGCTDAGFDVPSAQMPLCGEDCQCIVVTACGDGGEAIRLQTDHCIIFRGAVPAVAVYADPGGRARASTTATMTIPGAPMTGSAYIGTYAVTLAPDADGGAATDLAGNFCVMAVP